MHNRTQEEIDRDNENLSHLLQELNKDIHDNCDLNDCEACIGKTDSPSLEQHYRKMHMFESHI